MSFTRYVGVCVLLSALSACAVDAASEPAASDSSSAFEIKWDCVAHNVRRYFPPDEESGRGGVTHIRSVGDFPVVLNKLPEGETATKFTRGCPKRQPNMMWAFEDTNDNGKGEYDGAQAGYVICSATPFTFEFVTCEDGTVYRPSPAEKIAPDPK